VVTTATTRFAPGIDVIPQTFPRRQPTPTVAPLQQCPRCHAKLVRDYDEPMCMKCGFQDYAHVAPTNGHGKSILSTATRYILRYVGDSRTLSESLAHVKVERLRNRVIYKVNCPFSDCQKTMEQSSLSGKRPVVQEQRYKCDDGHRVSLVPGKNGMFGWK